MILDELHHEGRHEMSLHGLCSTAVVPSPPPGTAASSNASHASHAACCAWCDRLWGCTGGERVHGGRGLPQQLKISGGAQKSTVQVLPPCLSTVQQSIGAAWPTGPHDMAYEEQHAPFARRRASFLRVHETETSIFILHKSGQANSRQSSTVRGDDSSP